VKEMADTLQFNQHVVDEIKQVLRYLAENKEHIDWQRLYRLISTAEQLKYTLSSDAVHTVVNRTALSTRSRQMVNPLWEYCAFSESVPKKTDIQVFSLRFCFFLVVSGLWPYQCGTVIFFSHFEHIFTSFYFLRAVTLLVECHE